MRCFPFEELNGALIELGNSPSNYRAFLTPISVEAGNYSTIKIDFIGEPLSLIESLIKGHVFLCEKEAGESGYTILRKASILEYIEIPSNKISTFEIDITPIDLTTKTYYIILITNSQNNAQLVGKINYNFGLQNAISSSIFNNFSNKIEGELLILLDFGVLNVQPSIKLCKIEEITEPPVQPPIQPPIIKDNKIWYALGGGVILLALLLLVLGDK